MLTLDDYRAAAADFSTVIPDLYPVIPDLYLYPVIPAKAGIHRSAGVPPAEPRRRAARPRP